MYNSTAQVSPQQFVFVLDDQMIVDDVVLVSIPSGMRPGANSIILAIQGVPEAFQRP